MYVYVYGWFSFHIFRQKFIEENLAKKKGVEKEKENKESENKYLSPEEAALQSVPDYLRKSSGKRNEEMLSNQVWLNIAQSKLVS